MVAGTGLGRSRRRAGGDRVGLARHGSPRAGHRDGAGTGHQSRVHRDTGGGAEASLRPEGVVCPATLRPRRDGRGDAARQSAGGAREARGTRLSFAALRSSGFTSRSTCHGRFGSHPGCMPTVERTIRRRTEQRCIDRIMLSVPSAATAGSALVRAGRNVTITASSPSTASLTRPPSSTSPATMRTPATKAPDCSGARRSAVTRRLRSAWPPPFESAHHVRGAAAPTRSGSPRGSVCGRRGAPEAPLRPSRPRRPAPGRCRTASTAG